MYVCMYVCMYGSPFGLVGLADGWHNKLNVILTPQYLLASKASNHPWSFLKWSSPLK